MGKGDAVTLITFTFPSSYLKIEQIFSVCTSIPLTPAPRKTSVLECMEKYFPIGMTLAPPFGGNNPVTIVMGALDS